MGTNVLLTSKVKRNYTHGQKTMPLTQQDIEELKQIHKKEFKETLTDEDAWEMARRLLRFGELMLSCIRNDESRNTTDPDSNRVSFD